MAELLPIKTTSSGQSNPPKTKDDPVTGITPNSSTTIGMSALATSIPPDTAITTPSNSPADDLINKQSISPPSNDHRNISTSSTSQANEIINKQSIPPAAKHLSEHISGMRMLSKAISDSLDLIDKSWQYVASVGPAIKASEEIEKSRSRLQKQKGDHQAELDRLEADLAAQLQKALKDSLRKEALKLVKQQVREELETLVNKELHLQIPPEFYDQTRNHPVKMTASRVNIYNAEARARNTSVQAGSEPLRPLWLPTGKAHALFPQTVRVCADLPENDIDTLLQVYEIMPTTEKSLAKGTANKSPAEGSNKSSKVKLTREEKINIFMAFIGVTLRVMRPTPPSTASGKDAKKPGPTLVINSYC